MLSVLTFSKSHLIRFFIFLLMLPPTCDPSFSQRSLLVFWFLLFFFLIVSSQSLSVVTIPFLNCLYWMYRLSSCLTLFTLKLLCSHVFLPWVHTREVEISSQQSTHAQHWLSSWSRQKERSRIKRSWTNVVDDATAKGAKIDWLQQESNPCDCAPVSPRSLGPTALPTIHTQTGALRIWTLTRLRGLST
jgi:hypothetical protein